MTALIDEEKIEAMEYIRKAGGKTAEAIEFASFAVGFPRDMALSQIYLSYLVAKHGPEQISMDTQGGNS